MCVCGRSVENSSYLLHHVRNNPAATINVMTSLSQSAQSLLSVFNTLPATPTPAPRGIAALILTRTTEHTLVCARSNAGV